jgi:hypothetical protein
VVDSDFGLYRVRRRLCLLARVLLINEYHTGRVYLRSGNPFNLVRGNSILEASP